MRAPVNAARLIVEVVVLLTLIDVGVAAVLLRLAGRQAAIAPASLLAVPPARRISVPIAVALPVVAVVMTIAVVVWIAVVMIVAILIVTADLVHTQLRSSLSRHCCLSSRAWP